MKLDLNLLWWMCEKKFSTILLPNRIPDGEDRKAYKKKRIQLWLAYLESAGIKVRRSRECFFKWEDVVVLSGFNPRRTYKIGIPIEMAEKILVLGGLP